MIKATRNNLSEAKETEVQAAQLQTEIIRVVLLFAGVKYAAYLAHCSTQTGTSVTSREPHMGRRLYRIIDKTCLLATA